MGLVNVSNLYAYIHQVLREDAQLQTLLGLTPTSTMEEMATKIQKRRRPSELVQNNLPIITFYKNPGQRGYQNHLEYSTPFDFDIYTQDDVEAALQIADRIGELFSGKRIGIPCGSYFKARYVTSAEDDTAEVNTYKYFTRLVFDLVLDEDEEI